MINFTKDNEVITDEAYDAIIVGLEIKENIDKSMDELKALAEADEVNVLASMVQKLKKPNTATYIGRGKLTELAEAVKNMDANLVIFNDELSGVQLRNIEDTINVRVIDRTGLILDIFAKRAISLEGKLQVEYAQLKYRLPRLIGFGSNLSRLGAGIGTRGPGEKKLEIDRRHIQTRMDEIKKQLVEVKESRETQRVKRQKSDLPIVSLVGYTNSGKSALMNKLLEITNREEKQVFEKNMLFATLDTAQRLIKMENGCEFIITDTVGFVSKLPHSLINAFKSTLEELLYSDLIVHVIDMTSEDFQFKLDVTREVLSQLGVTDKKEIVVFNKKDIAVTKPQYSGESLLISAKTGEGVSELLNCIKSSLFSDRKYAEILLPYERGDIISYLCEKANVKDIQYLENGTLVKVDLSTADYARLQSYDTL
ncbi:MAG: GTPase HflX [Eubacteriales bacterium]